MRRPPSDWQASRGGNRGYPPPSAASYARAPYNDFPTGHGGRHPEFHAEPPHSARGTPAGKVIGVEYRELPGLGALAAPIRSTPGPIVVTNRDASPGGVQSSEVLCGISMFDHEVSFLGVCSVQGCRISLRMGCLRNRGPILGRRTSTRQPATSPRQCQ